MKKLVVLFVSSVVGATAVAPAAYAYTHHRRVHHHMMAAPMMMANPRINAAGQFYATPISATGIGVPGTEAIPGLGLAVGVVNGVAGPTIGAVNGVANPILAPGGIVNGAVVAPLDAAGKVVDPLFAPLAQVAPPT